MTLSEDQHEAAPAGLSGAQKAAILLLCLPEREATELLRRLPEAALAQMSREMARLADVPQHLRMEVLAEFCDMAEAGAAGRASHSRRFAFLRNVQPPELVALLEREPPRSSAVVLTHLSSAQAGEILAALSPYRQVQVVRQIAALGAVAPQEAVSIENQLMTRLANGAAVVRSLETGAIP